MDVDSIEGLKRVKILRSFLRMVGGRWLACGELSNDF